MCVEEIWVPGPKVGMVIGKGGETIKRLQVRKKERNPGGDFIVPLLLGDSWLSHCHSSGIERH